MRYIELLILKLGLLLERSFWYHGKCDVRAPRTEFEYDNDSSTSHDIHQCGNDRWTLWKCVDFISVLSAI